jgi:threonine synthase
MDCEIAANRNGHIACTHGGESLAGLMVAKNREIIGEEEIAVLNSTAHALKFAGFQDMYFSQDFPPEYNITPNPNLINAPIFVHPQDLDKVPTTGKPLKGAEFKRFVKRIAEEIALMLDLKKN